MGKRHAAVFLAAFLCICLELFLTCLLNLKAWNHVVYTVIPFAMLGMGIGANLVLMCPGAWKNTRCERVAAILLLLAALTGFAAALLLKDLPIHVEYIMNLAKLQSLGMLLLAYTIFIVPFILIGFLVVYLFAVEPADFQKMYFFDLLGAAAGAAAFFLLINRFGVIHSLLVVSTVCAVTGAFLWGFPHRWLLAVGFAGLCAATLRFYPEPVTYAVDPAKGWEWISGYFHPWQYTHQLSRWHPLGRTDVFRIRSKLASAHMLEGSRVTFQINLDPPPPFSYLSTNFLGGTPVYAFSTAGLAKNHSELKLFSQPMETVYKLLDKPNVVIIGTGGGRDIFMAHSHSAASIIGAEINPATYAEMAPGGRLYEYSGRVYTSPGTRVYNVDGRHLVKTLKDRSADLVLLNGVDTFTGLSSGAYAYSESYLYTQEAIADYLRLLNDEGYINMFRWAFPVPREELRLFAMALQALKDQGSANPLDHIIVGITQGWSLLLVKKTAFTAAQRQVVYSYFQEHDVGLLYPLEPGLTRNPADPNAFVSYGDFFERNMHKVFENSYPYDISVVKDDNPFFFKYYKFSLKEFMHPILRHHTGTVVFVTQALILVQALLFILLFIFVPLLMFKRQGIRGLPAGTTPFFVLFFACLGAGFMFIEISMMQRFVLLLGSPIYSISIILAALLAFTGMGSLLVAPRLQKARDPAAGLGAVTISLTAYLFGVILVGTKVMDAFMAAPFFSRALVVTAAVLPLGLALGAFFPLGLGLLKGKYEGSMAWAWGINCGFSVLGSILAIIIAQFSGFNGVLMLASAIYLLALMAYMRLQKGFAL